MTSAGPDLPEFLDVHYEPDDKSIPGRLTIGCRFEDHGWPGRVIERSLIFQYHAQDGKLFFRVYPSLVQLPLGEAKDLEDATEKAKQFLKKRLGKDRQFQSRTFGEILRLEKEQEAAKRFKKGPPPSQGG